MTDPNRSIDPTQPTGHLLEYNSPQIRTAPEFTTAQKTLHFFFGMAAYGVILYESVTSGVMPTYGIYGILVPAIAAMIGSCWLARAKFGWKSFIPGMIVGFLLTPLIVLGICAVAAGSLRSL